MQRQIDAEVRLADEPNGICEYVASDESVDSGREIIRLDGWDFSRMEKNAPFLNSHQYRGIDNMLGKVLGATVENGELVERVQWAVDVPENRLAQLGWAMTKAGYLKAVSVGFLAKSILTRLPVQNWPEEWESASVVSAGTRDGKRAWEAQQDMMQRDLSQAATIYLQQQQTELSACVVGANPNAVAKSIQEFAHAFRAGILKEADLELLANEYATSGACLPGARPGRAGGAEQASRDNFWAQMERALKPATRAYSFTSQPNRTEDIQHANTRSMRSSAFLSAFSQLTGPTKRAFESADMSRRGGSESEIARAVRLAFKAQAREIRHSCGDPVERVLADPKQRLLWNAVGRVISEARMSEDEQRVWDELKPVTKDFVPGISTASQPGAMLFPIPVSPDVWDLLLTFGAFRDLGVRPIESAYERFATVTALPSAIFLTPLTQGQVMIPADTSFTGMSMFDASNTVAARLLMSYDLVQDVKTDVANAVLSYLSIALAARLDWAAFSGSGANDQLNGGQIGIFFTQGIRSFVPAPGATNISNLCRTDFVNTVGAVTPAALQRAENCRWYINPALIPALMQLYDGQGPQYLLKTPAETQDEWYLTGFPVTWASQAPAANQAGAPIAAFGEKNSYVVALREVYELQRCDWVDAQTMYQYRALMRGFCQMRNPAGFATLQLAPA
jgi:HK97 family phage major capsid protein